MQKAELRDAEARANSRQLSTLTSALCSLISTHLFPLALIALLATIIFFAPLVKKEAFSFRDHLDYFQPLRWFTAQELSAGRLPLWNPYNASGEPWLANPQTGVFYPPAWLLVVLPFATAYMLYLLFHLLLLGGGAYLLFVRRASSGAAMVGAVALMLSGPTLSLLDVSNNLATFAWIPLVVWCALERATIRGAFALAMAFLAGEPFFAAIAAVMFVIASRKWRDILIAGDIALGLTAIQLFPFVALLRGSDRAQGYAAGNVLHDAMSLRDWSRLFLFPHLDENGFDPNLTQHFVPLVYVGALIGVFALIGVALSVGPLVRWSVVHRRANGPTDQRANGPTIAGWLALLAFASVIGSGPQFVASMPLTLFRYPARLVPFAAMAIVAMAVAGWDRIRPDKRWVDLIVVLILATDLMSRAKPLLESAPPGPHRVLYGTDVGVKAKFFRLGEMPPGARASWVSGYLNLYQWRFDAGTPAPVVAAEYDAMIRRLIEKPDGVEIAEFPIGHLITTHELRPPFTRDLRIGSVNVYRVPFAQPMARLAHGSAVLEVDTSHAFVTIDSSGGGNLLVALRDGLGWRVTIDGQPREKRPAARNFLSVDVPPGRHLVVFTYRPASFLIGAVMTFITLALLSIFFVVKRSRGEIFFFRSPKI